MENEYIDVSLGFELPKGKELRFLNYIEEYLLKKEKENPNIKLGKIDLPGFTIFGIHEIILISREFGFIERLVKNDKIDLEEVEKINQTGNVYIRFGGDYEKVLMLLSIQDNPIEYLCSILKE